MKSVQSPLSQLEILASPPWKDYELIDSGDGQKFERFGSYYLIRPETQAIWTPALPASEWERADAVFQKSKQEDGPGQWNVRRPLPEQWQLHYNNLSFWVRLSPFRHTGVFPEHTAQWGWMQRQLARLDYQPNVLVLFGYTGLTSLWAAQLGARVCHVDASKPALRWAQDNQSASSLQQSSIRWIVDDALKFVAREIRRGNRYDLILMDPPVFGRGPKGEIWRLHEQLPHLVTQTAELLSENACGMLINAYATNMSALTLGNVLHQVLRKRQGSVSAGELAISERESGRLLPTALYACWSGE